MVTLIAYNVLVVVMLVLVWLGVRTFRKVMLRIERMQNHLDRRLGETRTDPDELHDTFTELKHSMSKLQHSVSELHDTFTELKSSMTQLQHSMGELRSSTFEAPSAQVERTTTAISDALRTVLEHVAPVNHPSSTSEAPSYSPLTDASDLDTTRYGDPTDAWIAPADFETVDHERHPDSPPDFTR